MHMDIDDQAHHLYTSSFVDGAVQSDMPLYSTMNYVRNSKITRLVALGSAVKLILRLNRLGPI